jgi:PhzF family phenazine biosynthesis protein
VNRARPFQQVDVFTAVPFKGNPVAVVGDANGLSTSEMQAIATWTNLSETTFMCVPASDADYRLRIFTPRGELPFAGHPTIGSARAFLSTGGSPKIPGRLRQECGKGIIDLAIEDDELFFAVPEATVRDVEPGQLARTLDACGLPAGELLRSAIVDMGPAWLTIQAVNADAVLALVPDMGRLAAVPGITGVTIFGASPAGRGADFEVRSFAPGEGVPEDPVCGSGNGSVAVLVRRDRLVPGNAYRARQGQCVARDGRISVRFDHEGRIWIGGQTVVCVNGTIGV